VHAEKLMVQVAEVLVKSGVSLHDLDGIAISIGPGSFTGLRIGLGVAKGLAFAVGLPLIPVPTMLALAQRLVDERMAVKGDTLLAVLDARRDEVYRCYFNVMGGNANPISTEMDVPLSRIIDDMPSGRVLITGDGKNKLREALNGAGSRSGTQPVIAPDGVADCSAGSVGRVGGMLLQSGRAADVSTLEPSYIKEFFFKPQSP